MSKHAQGHPPIPPEVPVEAVIAIVSIYDAQAANVNRDTPFRKTALNSQRPDEGCHIFLHQIEGQPCYIFGRIGQVGNKVAAPDTEPRDVLLPGTRVGMKQFVLVPVWESNIWRLLSRTETVATVNNVPIQAFTNRTKKNKGPLPHAVHLKTSTVNRISIKGLLLDIWVLKSVREVYPTSVFDPEPLQYHLQDVTRRPEQWARDRYILSSEHVSANSFRVVERFTSEVGTAKLFRDEHHGLRLRDEEFLKFGKEDVDVSLVQYQQSVEIDNIPAVITSTHNDFVSYVALQADIKTQHPGVRFSIAAKLLRRLFSALGFLHFQRIIHGHITQENVLLRLKDYEPEAVLLVDYSESTIFPVSDRAPLDALKQDGQAAMRIIEDCCDIWQLRKAATKDARNEEWMAKKTTTAQKEHQIIKRVVADFERKGGSRTSVKGKKLLRLLEQKDHNWNRCMNEQLHNATRREVGVCYKSNIDEMTREWDKSHPDPLPKIGEKHFMLLSLGHPWFDQLATQLYHQRWDTTPKEVCAKFKELASAVEDPWRTFEVTKAMTFVQNDTGFDEKCVMAWLAGCCDAFPEWHQALEMESEHHIRPQDGTVTRHNIRNLRDALLQHGRLPESMVRTFDLLLTQQDKQQHLRISEAYHVSWHTPSRMFNLTQLQNLASADRFVLCVNDGGIRCDNYVEVRGEPKLQGCYVPLSLLFNFANRLDLTVPDDVDQAPIFPAFDPSDFSQAHSGKIILARTGLVAFASVTRTGDQCVFHAPKSYTLFETVNTFLPTYFGDMKVLPQLPAGIYEHVRPDHWSKFKTAEEIEDTTNVGKRKILRPKGPLDKLTAKPYTMSRGSKPTFPMYMDVDESALSRVLKQRQHIRSQARPPTKRNTNAQSSDPSTPIAKRSCPSNHVATPPLASKESNITVSFLNRAAERMERMAANLPIGSSLSVPRIPNTSFFQRNANVNANVLSSPPRAPADKNQSFTVAAGSFNLDDDWKQAEEWLKNMPDKEDKQPQVQGIFGFDFHHSHLQEGSSTEEETSSGGKSKRKESGSGKRSGKSSPASLVGTPTRVSGKSTLSAIFEGGQDSSRRIEAATPMAHGEPRAQSKSFPAPKVSTTTRKGKGKVTALSISRSASFPRRPTPEPLTPEPSSPVPRPVRAAAAPSLVLGPTHRHDVSISKLADVSLGWSDMQTTLSGLAQPTDATTVPGIQDGVYSDPDGAVHDWINDLANVAQNEDDDMPDTDVESWNGDIQEE
ncbi:Nn.00g069020.m01.CDS01 [Neocucurbitaria sp. VM-36]